jgi:hypothetical protein
MVPAGIGHGRHVMDDVAQGRSLDEQDLGHRGWALT